MLNIALIEDDPQVHEPIQAFLNAQTDMQVVAKAETVEDLLDQQNPDQPPQIILLDISLPGGMSGLQGIQVLKQTYPEVEIIMLTSSQETGIIFQALQQGAVAYLHKQSDLPTIRDSIAIVAQGGSYMSPSIARKVAEFFRGNPTTDEQQTLPEKKSLTSRQMDIVQGLIDGLSYKMIADRLDISHDTVRDHIKKIYKTLEMNSKAEVIAYFMKNRNW